jgi:hypothetical protein
MGQPAQQVLEYLLVWTGPASIGEIYGISMESLSALPTYLPASVFVASGREAYLPTSPFASASRPPTYSYLYTQDPGGSFRHCDDVIGSSVEANEKSLDFF